MKKTLIIILTTGFVLAGTFLNTSCGSSGKPEPEQQQASFSTPDNGSSGESEQKTVTSSNNGGTPVHLTKEMFLRQIWDYEKNSSDWKYKGDVPCIIDFYADWCRPCRMVAPIMDELAKEYKGKVNIYKINTDKEPELAALFNVRSIPAVLFVPMKEKPQMSVGALPKETFVSTINDFLLKKPVKK